MPPRPTGPRGRQNPDSPARESIHEQILPHIRRDIVLNRWQPGERLPEMDLCIEFGISRTPLRDVLKILEVEGFVALTPHVGAVVTRMDHSDLAEKFEVMSGMEQIAAMKIARLQPAGTLLDMQRLHRSMARSAKEAKAAQYFRQNDEFHRTLVLGCANATLSRLHETLMFHVSRARNRANFFEPLEEGAFEHHSAIVSAILSGDSAAAGAAIAAHLEEVTSMVLSRIEILHG